MSADIDILLCYRGRFKRQLERLDRILTTHKLHITFDAQILTPAAVAVIEPLKLSAAQMILMP